MKIPPPIIPLLAGTALGVAATVGVMIEAPVEQELPPEIECLTPDCEIEKLELVLEEKKANGEGLTRTVQKINELKSRLK